MSAILIAVIVVCSIAILCAVMLVVASKFFAVEEDEKMQNIRECLPGANCGACGYAGCDGYAKALADGVETKANKCIPGADACARKISELLGVAFEDVVEQVAIIHCSGDCEHTSTKLDYEGIRTCEAAKMFYGGNGSCTFGCIGFGDCMSVCPQGAICIQNGVAHIDTRKCIGCGLCAKACPQKLIEIVDDTERVIITCSNKEKGAIVRKECTNGCIGCKKCEKNCPAEAITVSDNLAKIDYNKCTLCYECAKNCPVGCILISDLTGLHNYKN